MLSVEERMCGQVDDAELAEPRRRHGGATGVEIDGPQFYSWRERDDRVGFVARVGQTREQAQTALLGRAEDGLVAERRGRGLAERVRHAGIIGTPLFIPFAMLAPRRRPPLLAHSQATSAAPAPLIALIPRLHPARP